MSSHIQEGSNDSYNTYNGGSCSLASTGWPPPSATRSTAPLYTPTSLPPLPQQNYSSQSTASFIYNDLIKQILPSVLTVFICSVLVVVRPIATLSGAADFAFLVLVSYTLYFHVGGHTVGQHIQTTLIGIIGTCIGLGWSALAIELGCVANRRAGSLESIGGRVAPAVFLSFIAFVGAYLKSRLPRLAPGCLVGIFVAIWLLASAVRTDAISATPFLGLLYSVLFAAGVSLLVTLAVFPVTANARLATRLTDAFGTASELLLASLHLFQEQTQAGRNHNGSSSSSMSIRQVRERVLELRTKLSDQATALKPAYEAAQYEVTLSYFPMTRYEPLLQSVLKFQATLNTRMGLDTSAVPSLAIRHPIYEGDEKGHVSQTLLDLVDELGKLNLRALQITRGNLAREGMMSTVRSLAIGGGTSQGVEKIQKKLDETVLAFKTATADALENALLASEGGQEGQTEFDRNRLFRSNAFKDCFFFTSLVDLSQDVEHALLLSAELPDPGKGARRRLWFPVLSRKYFLSGRGTSSEQELDDDEAVAEQEEESHNNPGGAKKAEDGLLPSRGPSHMSGLAGYPPSFQLQRPRHRLLKRLTRPAYYAALLSSLRMGVLNMWNAPVSTRRRFRLHKWLTAIGNSRHLKHAFKCTLGVSLLSLPGHLPHNFAGYRWYLSARGNWIPISFLFCFQTTTAATYRVAFYRTLGTLLGALYALAAQRIVKQNPYGLVAAMTLQAAFTDYLIILQPRYQNLGTVTQLTVPPILFVPYLHLSYPTVVELAFIRAYDIELGIIAALLVSVLIWPYHARVQFVTTCAKTTDKLIKLYLSMSKAIMRKDTRFANNQTKHQYERLENSIRASLTRSKGLCELVHIELSLLPRPIAEYRHLVTKLNELLSLFSGLRSIRQHIPRKLTVIDVLPQRTELVSSILITMHAVSHSLHTGSPIPQFLPQPRIFLDLLFAAIEEHVEEIYAGSPSANILGLSLPSIVAIAASDLRRQRNPSQFGRFARTTSGTPTPRGEQPGRRLGFSFAFALAENEAISEVVTALDEILETCKLLYGSADFIQADEAGLVSMTGGYNTPVVRSARPSMSGMPSPRIVPESKGPVIVKGGSVD